MLGAQKILHLLGFDFAFLRHRILVGITGFRHHEIRERHDLGSPWCLMHGVLRNVVDDQRIVLHRGLRGIGLGLRKRRVAWHECRRLAVDLLDGAGFHSLWSGLRGVDVGVELQLVGIDLLVFGRRRERVRALLRLDRVLLHRGLRLVFGRLEGLLHIPRLLVFLLNGGLRNRLCDWLCGGFLLILPCDWLLCSLLLHRRL